MINKAAVFFISTNTISTLFKFVSTIVLTRLLAPEAFALIGIVTSVMFVIQLVSDIGFRSYLLRHSTDPTPELVSNLWLIQVARGIVLTVLGMSIAGPVSHYISIEGFESGVRVASLMFVINGFASLSPILHEKKGLVTRPILLEFLAGLLGSIAMLALTIVYKNVWCVIVGALFPPILSLIFSYVFYRRFQVFMKLDSALTRDFFNWAKFIVPSSIITIFVVQSDKFILSEILSAEQLGFYFMALNISMIGTYFIKQFSNAIIAPALAQNPNASDLELHLTFYNTKHNLLILCAIGLGISIAASYWFVGLIYDERYTPVGFLLAILLLRAVLNIWSQPIEIYLISRGYVKSTLIGNVLRAVWIASFLFPAYYYVDFLGVILVFVSSEVPVFLYFSYKARVHGAISWIKESHYALSFVAAFAVVKLLF
jgi:O-antigen/teichoic acid export membrane protein